MDKNMSDLFVEILNEELVPSTGCTEPIAIAYCAAYARDVLGEMPDRIEVALCGNLIKNAKTVTIPGTTDLCGIEAAAILGTVGGNKDVKMEVLQSIGETDIKKTKELLAENYCKTDYLNTVAKLHLITKAYKGESFSEVEILHAHTNVTKVIKDGEVVLDTHTSPEIEDFKTDRSLMTVANIIEFANTVNLDEVSDVLKRQIDYNMAIAERGINETYGLNVGRLIVSKEGCDSLEKAKGYASAGSDARMAGCQMPVVINSGSGNQGMTVSIPIVVYARENNIPEDKMYRALLVSNLIPIHIKSGIGRLSAFCGAVSAACGTGAAITYLENGTLKQIEDTITNVLADVAGMVCDGAKASCAIKIASSLDSAFMSYKLAMDGKVFSPNSGLVKNDIESTLSSVGRMAKRGMESTDKEILQIILDKQ